MFSRIEVTVPVDVFAAIDETARNAPKLMQTAYERAVRNMRRDLVQALQPQGDHIRPTPWESIKQQRFWFWALRMGIILWSGRTLQLEKGWKTDLQTTDEGGVFSFYNTQPSKIFVQGSRQQRMHKGTWPNEADVLAEFAPRAEEILIQTWYTVSNPFAGAQG